MILDKVIVGVLDQGAGCVTVYEEAECDTTYDAALETTKKLSNVVDVLYTNQAAYLEYIDSCHTSIRKYGFILIVSVQVSI